MIEMLKDTEVNKVQQAGYLRINDTCPKNKGGRNSNWRPTVLAFGLLPKQFELGGTNIMGIISKVLILGTIEKGKFADMALLSANPLVDIGNIDKIADVMVNGNRLCSLTWRELHLLPFAGQMGI